MEFVAVLFSAVAALAATASAFGTYKLAQYSRDNVKFARESVKQSSSMVEQNRKMVEEMKADRESRERPFIVVYIDYDHLPFLYLSVHNIGKIPARNIKFVYHGDLLGGKIIENYALEDPHGPLSHLELGIDFLGPGSKVLSHWGAFKDVAKAFETNSFVHQGIDVEVTYDRGDYESFRKPSLKEDPYIDVFNVNPLTYQYDPIPVSNQRKINDLINLANKTFERLVNAIDSRKGLKIITHRQIQRDTQKQFEADIRAAEEYRKSQEGDHE